MSRPVTQSIRRGVGAETGLLQRARSGVELGDRVPCSDGGAVRKEDPAREGSMVRVLDFDDVEIGEDGEVYFQGRLVLGNVHADEELGVVVVESAA